MVDLGRSRKAKRYALEIYQWLDGLLNDEGIDDCIEFETNNTVEGLSKQLIELKKSNQKYKFELEELNSKYLEMLEYVNVKNQLQEFKHKHEEYKVEMEKKVYNLQRRNEIILEEKTALELKNKSLEETNQDILLKNEDLIKKLDHKCNELNIRTQEKIEVEEELMKTEFKYKSQIQQLMNDKEEINSKYIQINDSLNNQKNEISEMHSKEISEKELHIQRLNEECLHNKYKITELEKLLKMAENEQLVTKNYRSLIEQYKNRLQVLENSEKNYLELQEKWNAQEKVIRQQSERLTQAENWLKRMVELEQINTNLSQQIKQWETMALRYTHNLRIYNNEFLDSSLNTESITSIIDDIESKKEFSEERNIQNQRHTISPTTVLSAIFEFQRRYQDVLVSKTVMESSKMELENKIDALESKLQVSERKLKSYEDEVSFKSREIQNLMDNNKKMECELLVLKECLSKEGKSHHKNNSHFHCDLTCEHINNDETDSSSNQNADTKIYEAHRLDLEEKTKIITHLENELKLRNEEIKNYWSIRVAYDTLTQERDSLLETSNVLQSRNNELKTQLFNITEKLKLYENNELNQNHFDSNTNERNYSILRDKYNEEQRRNITLSEYYIKERNDLIDAVSNILGWRIEIIYVENGLTAYKLSNIFSSHGGELIFVIRPAPIDNNNMNSLSNTNNATTFLFTNENTLSDIEMEEQLTLDFIGYYANKFEEDSNWALQLTATQSYPAFMAYTCLEEFHTTNRIQPEQEEIENQNKRHRED